MKNTLTHKQDLNYFRGQICPRRRRILHDRRLLVVALLASAIGISCTHLPIGEVTASSLATAGLSFAALSFGACVTGAVLALTIPAPEIKLWATTSPAGGRHSHYSDLIFSFTWSGLAQLLLALTSILGFLFGGENKAAPPNVGIVNSISLSIAVFVFLYAFVQLIDVILTISQIGVVLIAAWQQRPTDHASSPLSETQEARSTSEHHPPSP